jgi:hypothetical protein
VVVVISCGGVGARPYLATQGSLLQPAAQACCGLLKINSATDMRISRCQHPCLFQLGTGYRALQALHVGVCMDLSSYCLLLTGPSQ